MARLPQVKGAWPRALLDGSLSQSLQSTQIVRAFEFRVERSSSLFTLELWRGAVGRLPFEAGGKAVVSVLAPETDPDVTRHSFTS